MELTTAFRLLDFALYAMQRAPVAMENFKALRESVAQMVEENRDPTSEEWAAMRTLLNGLSEEVIEAKAAEARAALGQA